jgi:enoyl-[acyl-carrier protein] reductase II
MVMMKQVTPVRLMKNHFFQQVLEAEQKGATAGEMKQLLGSGRAKRGMFEGDMEEGELEIGQVSALINQILPAGQIVKNTWTEFTDALSQPLSHIEKTVL